MIAINIQTAEQYVPRKRMKQPQIQQKTESKKKKKMNQKLKYEQIKAKNMNK